MSYTLAVSPLLMPMLSDKDAVQLCSADAELAAILKFEIELAYAQEAAGVVPIGTAKAVAVACAHVELSGPEFEAALATDGVVVPAIVAALKTAVGPAVAHHVHAQATSQDAVDTAFMMRAAAVVAFIRQHIAASHETLLQLDTKFGARSLMGRTRMQRALAITVADRLNAWQQGLAAADAALEHLHFPLQLSGAVGTQDNHAVKTHMAAALELSVLSHTWQTNRAPMLAIGNACAGLTGALGKVGADIALMAQNELAEITLRGGGASSAMPHKQNPVKAEMLVALARYNASLLSALHNAAVHEQERSGAAWTLEWLVLPQMLCATAGAGRLCHDLLACVESIGQ